MMKTPPWKATRERNHEMLLSEGSSWHTRTRTTTLTSLRDAESMKIVRLTPSNAAEYRALMLHAYASENDAFTPTVAEREPLPLAWWELRVSDRPHPSQLVLGAFVGKQLVGVVGLRFETRTRTRHKATLFGMFVQPRFRGRDIGRALISALLEHARLRPGTEVISLSVTESNEAAVRLYTSCGFAPFGIEPLANKVDDRYVSLVHMWRHIDPSTIARNPASASALGKPTSSTDSEIPSSKT